MESQKLVNEVECVEWEGMNKRYKQKEIRLLLHQNKTSLAGLIETRVKEINSNAILKAITPGWKIIHNYKDAANGRIWLV